MWNEEDLIGKGKPNGRYYERKNKKGLEQFQELKAQWTGEKKRVKKRMKMVEDIKRRKLQTGAVGDNSGLQNLPIGRTLDDGDDVHLFSHSK